MAKKEENYKDLKQELNDLLMKFESAQHEDVDEMLKDYDAAMKLIERIESKLKAAQEKLKS